MNVRYEPCSDCNNCQQFCDLQDSESTQAAINAYCNNCIEHRVVVSDDENLGGDSL